MKNDDAEYNLVCPFLTDDPAFAHGVEFGMLYQRMRTETEIAGPFLMDNQEQILLLASRLGWHVEIAEPIETPGWFQLVMKKAEAA